MHRSWKRGFGEVLILIELCINPLLNCETSNPMFSDPRIVSDYEIHGVIDDILSKDLAHLIPGFSSQLVQWTAQRAKQREVGIKRNVTDVGPALNHAFRVR